MGKTITTYINRWDGGMTSAIRSKNTKFARTVKQFDILSALNKMSPNPGMEVETFATGTAAATKISRYIATNDVLYGLGVKSTTAYAKVFTKSSPAAAWTAVTTGESAAYGRNENLFVEYQGKLYGARRNPNSPFQSVIWSWDYGDNTFAESARALTAIISSATTAPMSGLRFSKDDILYIAYDNYLVKYDGTTWTDPALTLPTNEIISSLAEYGNYLAIATKPKYKGGKSTLYLWDRDSSLATLSEKADWGTESLEVIEEVDGYIIGISTTAFAGMNNLDTKLIFKRFIGGAAGTQQLAEIPISSLTINFAGSQKANNRLYFMMSAEINSVQCDGVFSFGKLGENYAFSMDRLANNDIAITTPVPKGFLLYGDWMHCAYTTATVFVANRTISSSPYTTPTAIYESLIYDFGDGDISKKLQGVSVMTEPLPAAGTTKLEYKINADTTWTTVFTNTTDDSISHGAVNIESTGVTLPEFKEIQFRISATNNAVVTGLKFKIEVIDKALY